MCIFSSSTSTALVLSEHLDLMNVVRKNWVGYFRSEMKWIKGGKKLFDCWWMLVADIALSSRQSNDDVLFECFLNYYYFLFCRSMFVAIDPEASPSESGHDAAQHHLPDLRLSPGLRGLVLSERGNLLHCQNCRLNPVQLRVSLFN
jgi:hypothetical protein